MKLAVYSDVHGNLPALKAFIRHSVECGVRGYEFLGDAVNYGGKPEECLDEIIKLGLVGHFEEVTPDTDPSTLSRTFLERVYNGPLQGKILLGNNDAACCGLEDPYYFSGYAKDSALITKNTLLSEWHQKFLRSRPMAAPMNICNEAAEEGDPDRVVTVRYNHSAPGDLVLGDWQYVKPETNMEYIEYFFEKFDERICFVGHSHIPCGFVLVEGQMIPVAFPIPTKNYDKAIISVGSVGQPRRGQTRGSYVIVDTVRKTIDLEWFEYDIQRAMADILDTKLPEQNAQRLLYGKVTKKYEDTKSGHIQA
jgi:predicted phosphodiesterase